MKTRNKFHGIILGIYADMIGIKHECALNHLLLQKEALGDLLIPLSKVIREQNDFNKIKPGWFSITRNNKLWDDLMTYLKTRDEFSDDTVLSCATIAALLENPKQPDFAKYYHQFGNKYPNGGYGSMFKEWLKTEKPGLPYGGFTNGALMRLAPIGYLDISLEEKIRLTSLSVSATHDTFEAINPAKEMITLIDLITKGTTPLRAAHSLLCDNGKNELTRSLPELPYDECDGKCASTLENALSIICNSISPDNLIYNVIKTGGDTDTIGMIAGSIYGAQKDFYVPEYIQKYVKDKLPKELCELVF